MVDVEDAWRGLGMPMRVLGCVACALHAHARVGMRDVRFACPCACWDVWRGLGMPMSVLGYAAWAWHAHERVEICGVGLACP